MWPNGYCLRNLKRWIEFKSWRMLFEFPFCDNTCRKGMTPSLSLQLLANIWAELTLWSWYDNQFRRKKTLNSRHLYTWGGVGSACLFLLKIYYMSYTSTTDLVREIIWFLIFLWFLSKFVDKSKLFNSSIWIYFIFLLWWPAPVKRMS